MTLDAAVGTLIAGAVAVMFASAAVHKLRDLTRFTSTFAAYRLLPAAVHLPLSRAIPLFELGIAAGLLLNGVTRFYAALAGMILLVAYAAAIGINLRRGRLDLACGCGGPHERLAIASWMVWRNLAMALFLASTLAPWSRRSLELTDGITISLGVLALALIYLSLERLMVQAGFANSPRGSL